MAKILVMKTKGKKAPKVDKGRAKPEILLKGKYKTKTWNHWTGEDDRLYCGIWECSPGKVKIDYSEWEFCHFIEGKAVLTNEEGETWTLKAGKLASVEDRAPWLAAAPRSEWPTRGRGGGTPRDFTPATGTLIYDREKLERGLAELAGTLVGGPLFRALSSLLVTECGDRKPTFAFVLRTDGEPVTYEYAPTACTFVPGSGDTIAGLECYASDLAAVLAGELGAIALTFGRSRLWHHLAGRIGFDPFSEMHRLSHPLRKPAAYLATYEQIWKSQREVSPSLGH